MTARGARPNDRLNLAIIGCGGQGAENLGKVAGENIVALCDVDEKRAADAFKRYPKAKRFRDYRKMLDAMHGQIDAVVVSIPDHMHAPVSLAAMELGKHVYCEKPLTWSIDEARRMARVAQREEAGDADGHPGDGRATARRAGIEVIRSGVLGEVTEIARLDRSPRGMVAPGGRSSRATRPPVPSGPGLEPLAGRGAGSGRITRPIAPSSGGDGRTSAPAPWETWASTTPPCRSPRWTSGPPAVGGAGRDLGAQARDLSGLVAVQARICSQRRPRPDHAVLVRWGTEAVSGAGWRPQARRQRRDRRGHERNALVGGVDRWRLGPVARGSVSRLQTAPTVRSRRAPDQSHHQEWLAACRGGAAGLLPVRRLRLPVDRDHARGQPRACEPAGRSSGMPKPWRPGAAPRRPASSDVNIAPDGENPSHASRNQPDKIFLQV